MVNTGTHKLLRVGEVSRLTGVSTSAINYYVREGLLPPPLKTAPNMAYYDPGYVDMVNSIRVLQREKGLTLAEIRELLQQGRYDLSAGFPPEDFTGADGIAAGSRRALDRRKHIMMVAASAFAEKGYYTTTMADLAEAAGIAKGTIYWYFDNKRSIMMSILDDIFEEIRTTFQRAMKGTADGLEALLNCVEPAFELLEKHGPIYLMYFLEIGSTDSKIQEKFRQMYETIHAGAKIQINRGFEQGVIREVDPDVAAYAVIGMVERIGQVGVPSDKKLALELKASQTKDFLRSALASERQRTWRTEGGEVER